MSSAPPKRARSRRCKPQHLKFSFGSSSSASGSLPSTIEARFTEVVEQLQIKRQQAQVEDDHWYYEDANGNVAEWSPPKYSMQDFETDSPEALDYGPDLARGQEEVGDHLDASGDATVQSSSHRQDFELDRPKAVENGGDFAGLEQEEDPPAVARDAEVLTEMDMADIVRRAREFLEERGPSQEEELCCEEVVGPKQAALVRASFGSLAACLLEQPGFRHAREGDYSFLYYLDDPEEGEEDSHPSAIDTPPPSACPEDGPADARGVAEGDGHVSSPCSSPSRGSYVSALEELEGVEERRGRRDACTQTPSKEEAPSPCQMHGVPRDTHDGQTQTCCLNTTQLVEEELRLKEKICVLEAKIASLEDDHNREIRELRLELEGLLHCGCRQAPSLLPPPPEQPSQQEAASGCPAVGEEAHHGSPSTNEGGVTGASSSEEEEGAEGAQLSRPVVPDNVLVNGVCTEDEVDGSHAGASSSHSGGGGGAVLVGPSSREGAAHTEEEGLPSEPVAKPNLAENKNGSNGPNAECPRAPEFMELHWRLEQLGGNTSADLKSVKASSRCVSTCSTPKSKSEAQIAKIVKLLKKRLPRCTEADVRGHLEHVRRLQGGFSCMTLKDIVTLVLNHVRGKEEESEQER